MEIQLANYPVKPATIVVTGCDEDDLTDDGNGRLLLNTKVVGSIDYRTGLMKIDDGIVSIGSVLYNRAPRMEDR